MINVTTHLSSQRNACGFSLLAGPSPASTQQPPMRTAADSCEAEARNDKVIDGISCKQEELGAEGWATCEQRGAKPKL